MPTLLLEIGCEELPASRVRGGGGAASGARARRTCPETASPRSFVGPRRLAVPPARRPRARGGPGRAAARALRGDRLRRGRPPDAGGGGVRALERVSRSRSSSARTASSGPSSGSRAAAPPSSLPGAPRAGRRRASPSRSRCAGTASGLRFARPVRWLCAKLDERDDRASRSAASRRRRLASATGSSSGTVEIPHALPTTRDRLRDAGVEPDHRVRRDGDRRARSTTSGSGATRRASSTRSSTSSSARSSSTGTLRRALPRAAAARDRDGHAVAPALLPARRRAASRSSRTAASPDVIVRRATRTCSTGRLDDASFSYERDVERGHRGDARGARLDHVPRAGRDRSPTRRRGSRSSASVLGGGEASREAARLAKADQASTMVHEFPELEGFMGAEYARLAGVPEAVAAAIEEHYLPGPARRRRCRETAAGRCSPPPTRSTTSPSRSRSASGRPARATRTACAARRSGSAASPSRAGSRSTLPALVARDLELLIGAGRRGDRRPLGRLGLRARAARGPPRRPGRVRARRAGVAPSASSAPSPGSPRRSRRRRTPRRSRGAYTAYDRANRLAGRADGAAADARSAARDRAGRDGARRDARRGRRRGSRPRSRRGDFDAALDGRGRARPAGRPLLRRGARHGRGRGRSARTASGSSWTSATRSACSATCRRSRAERCASAPRDERPRRAPRHLRLDRRDRGQARDRGRGPVPGPRVRASSATRGSRAWTTSSSPPRGRAAGARSSIYTLVDPDYREAMRTLCKRYKLHYCDLLGHPIDAVARVSGLAGADGAGRAAGARLGVLQADRGDRVRRPLRRRASPPHGLHDADIVLVGVSRSSKTPLSIYLGYLGYKTANVPIVRGIEPPEELFDARPGEDRRPDDRRRDARTRSARARAQAMRGPKRSTRSSSRSTRSSSTPRRSTGGSAARSSRSRTSRSRRPRTGSSASSSSGGSTPRSGDRDDARAQARPVALLADLDGDPRRRRWSSSTGS